MKALFFGSPEFAVPCLEALVRIADVVQVVSQPDRPAGRGLALTPPPVKVRALELGLPVAQPTKVRVPEFAASLRALQADVGVVVAYGRILPRPVLDAPRAGCVNVHASLLPRHRGAAPIQWAVAHGDLETGVSLMQMDEGMDTGAVLSTLSTPIGPQETAGELAARLSALGAQLLVRDLACVVAGDIAPVPQDDAAATMAPLLTKEDGRLDFRLPAQQLHDRVRGMSPWPGAFTSFEGRPLKVHQSRVARDVGAPSDAAAWAPGMLLTSDPSVLRVACGEGALDLLELQEPGKKRLSAARYRAGRSLAPGARLGEGPPE